MSLLTSENKVAWTQIVILVGLQKKLWIRSQNEIQGKAFGLGHVSGAAKSLLSCLTLCDPIDSSPPGSPVPGILQARTLEWVAISFSKAWKWKVKAKSLSRVRLFATPWTAAHQAPPSMGFSRRKYWSGVPLPSPGHIPLPTPNQVFPFPVWVVCEILKEQSRFCLSYFQFSTGTS